MICSTEVYSEAPELLMHEQRVLCLYLKQSTRLLHHAFVKNILFRTRSEKE